MNTKVNMFIIPMTRRLRFAVEKMSTADHSELRPSVLRAMIATERWRKVLCQDQVDNNDDGRESAQRDDLSANNVRENDTGNFGVENGADDSDDGRTSGIRLDEIDGTGIARVDVACSVNPCSVGPTCSERRVRVATPAPLEAEAFETIRAVEGSVDETRAVGPTSALEADKTARISDGAVGPTCSERRVRVTTPAPLEAEAFETIRAVGLESFDETPVVIGDYGPQGVPENESASREKVTQFEYHPVEKSENERTAVSTAGANETTFGAGSRPVAIGIHDGPPVDPIVRRSPSVREENIKLFTKCKMLPRKNAHWNMSNYMKTVNRFLNKPQEQKSIDHLIKYWIMQNRLFSRFSMGILLDEESFFSVCPEVLCSHIANKCRCETIVDPFCGAGGNIIQFTKTCSRVIGIDVDAGKIRLARNNAKVYGVQNRIQLRTGDYFQCGGKPKADVVFMSPPWGGPEYINEPVYSLSAMCSGYGGGRRVLEIARKIAPKIAIHLPRNLDKSECVMMARDLNFEYILFENNYIGNKINSTTVYLK